MEQLAEHVPVADAAPDDGQADGPDCAGHTTGRTVHTTTAVGSAATGTSCRHSHPRLHAFQLNASFVRRRAHGALVRLATATATATTGTDIAAIAAGVEGGQGEGGERSGRRRDRHLDWNGSDGCRTWPLRAVRSGARASGGEQDVEAEVVLAVVVAVFRAAGIVVVVAAVAVGMAVLLLLSHIHL